MFNLWDCLTLKNRLLFVKLTKLYLFILTKCHIFHSVLARCRKKNNGSMSWWVSLLLFVLWYLVSFCDHCCSFLHSEEHARFTTAPLNGYTVVCIIEKGFGLLIVKVINNVVNGRWCTVAHDLVYWWSPRISSCRLNDLNGLISKYKTAYQGMFFLC